MAQPANLLDGRLKFRHLVLVDALTEFGSVTAAAAHLHLTQPAATRALREVEGILGVPLYERGPRGVRPTLFGAAFTEHTRAILARVTQAGRDVTELADAARGTTVVGTHLAGSNLLLPRSIARLKLDYPQVTVVVHEASPDALLADLDAGRVDFVVGRLVTSASHPTTEREIFYEEPIRLVGRSGHPAFSLPSLTLAGLGAFPWILPGPGTSLRQELDGLFVQNGLSLPGNLVECTSILTIRHLLAETDVIAALPESIAIGDPALSALPLALESISSTVGLTRPAGRPPSPSASVLLRCLAVVASEMRAELGAQ